MFYRRPNPRRAPSPLATAPSLPAAGTVPQCHTHAPRPSPQFTTLAHLPSNTPCEDCKSFCNALHQCIERVIPFFWRITRIMRTSCLQLAVLHTQNIPRVLIKLDAEDARNSQEKTFQSADHVAPSRADEGCHTHPRFNAVGEPLQPTPLNYYSERRTDFDGSLR